MFGTRREVLREGLILKLLILKGLNGGCLENAPFARLGGLREARRAPARIHPSNYAAERRPCPVGGYVWSFAQGSAACGSAF